MKHSSEQYLEIRFVP